MAIATEISDLLPLYLSGKIALRDALTFATATATPPSTKELLSTLLKESKSLPRTTDTDPTSPTPDRPSPAQERLLDFARGVHEILRRRRQGSEIGYGIELDADEGSFAGNNTEEEQEEEYELVKCVIVSSFPVASTTSLSLSLDGGEPSIFGNEHGYEPGYGYEERTHLEQRTSPPFDSFDSSDFASGSAPAPAPSPTRTTSQTQTQTQRRRRRSSAKQGTQKPFYNLISFLAFLTKERLLVSAGTGERIALEMARDTLSHLHPHIPLPLHVYGHAHSQKPEEEEEGGEKRWFGVGEASVTAVALWMIIMGEELFARIESYYHDNYCSSGSGQNKNKTTSEGSDGGCRWRAEWETWTSRLQFLSLCEDLGVSAREQAAEAAAVMRRV
ncbi:uncharacterized protein BJX67DRAFT_385072 [Aspergillus lucknowensis]|uniref:Uncharacterized protein n=1 Tax=Aspergillus lucknowensis TaxID=176173 RepID=A0ABR4LF72_9EURO